MQEKVEGARGIGRPRIMYMDNIIEQIEVGATKAVSDRGQGQRLLGKGIIPWVP